jgi:hypothetical protein
VPVIAGQSDDYGLHFWNTPLGQASDSDQIKSRRIQSLDGSGCGGPTGFELSNVMPSVPSFLTDETT